MWAWFNRIIATNTFSENAAHILAGYAAVLTAAHYVWPRWTLLAFVLAASFKEYIYDANFETPHQTFLMNTVDFLGYVVGIAIGVLVTHAL